MPLMIDHVWCREESDESGSDDVYVVVFRGNTTAPFNSNIGVHGPGEFWDDFDSGEQRSLDVSIAKFRTDAVYVVMLVEEDNSRDISGSAVIGFWKTQTALAWSAVMIGLHASSGTPLTAPLPEPQRGAAAQAIIDAMQGLSSIYMEFPKGNDDVLGVPKRIAIQQGQSVDVDFNGDGARYQVRFKA